jgi:cytochrome c oxidase subunit 4/cytochrome o ubiquinol oxidase operon protein cyoD
MAHVETHGYHEQHSTRIYWITAAILAVLTALEVTVFIVNETTGLLPKVVEIVILLVLSFGKGALVVANFMHLRGDAGVFKFLFFVPFLMASAMMISFLLIYGVEHVGIAG